MSAHTDYTTAAITGVGYLSPHGQGMAAFQRAASGQRPATMRLADYDPERRLNQRGVRFLSASSRLLTATALQALSQNSLLDVAREDPQRVGIYHGAEVPNLEDVFLFDLCAKNEGPEQVSPMRAPNTLANVAAGQLAITAGIMGANVTVSAGLNSGLQALDLAMTHLFEGRLRAAVVGGLELWSGYHETLQAADLIPGQASLTPETGAVAILEPATTARARGARILGYCQMLSCCRRARSMESVESALVSAIAAGLSTATVGSVDAVLVAGGAAFIRPPRLRDAWERFVPTAGLPALLCGEVAYGSGESSSGLLGLLLGLSLFSEPLLSVASALTDGFASPNVIVQRCPTLRSIVLCTVDRRGTYSAVMLRAPVCGAGKVS